VWTTSTRSAGLGTSGSGDVLAGLVGGAGARCGDRLQAACWGTYAHMEAGRRLAQSVGDVGYLARELLDEIPQCLPHVGEVVTG
jgi:NAD(P)H-hydrate repair Nnr-like enzyme with NAD(P)H-hydrate dehydratase domain